MLNLKAVVGVAVALSVLTAPSVLARDQVGSSAMSSQGPANRAPAGQTGQSQTVQGVTVTLQQLRSRQEPAKGKSLEASPRRAMGVRPSPPPGQIAVAPAQVISGRNSPQSLVDEILGPK